MHSSETHAVWEVYDLQRTVRLRIKYYCAKLDATKRQNMVVELILAATASGSALASLAFWSTSGGRYAWQLLAVVSAVLAVAKPLFAFPTDIQRLEEVVTGYRLLENRLGILASEIRHVRSYSPDLQTQFKKILEEHAAVVVKQPKSMENARLVRRFTEEVKNEMPVTHFFVPEER